METLNCDDLDWFTRAENRLLNMRKRETANANAYWVKEELNGAIEATHKLRQALQARFNIPVDKDLRS